MSKEDEMLEELKQIRILLEPKKAAPAKKGMWNEFMDFLAKYKVMGMAVAFIIGIYLGALVKAMVDDLVMPIVSIVIPGTEWETLMAGPFRIGHFADALITFVIVALVIFLIVKIAKRWKIE
jgi:large conductance mechanosensitive channel